MDRLFAIALALLVTACTATPAQAPSDLGQLGPTTTENVGNAAGASATWMSILGAQRVP